jgi:pyruvate/2-oxoglutarate dehydrogenase complex dihydrolipoamide acyltransferase (E2) component
MAVPVLLPDVGTSEVRVSIWHLQPGEPVYEGDRLVEVILPGATFDVPAPASGVLRDRLTLPGDIVAPGQVLGTIEPDSKRSDLE